MRNEPTYAEAVQRAVVGDDPLGLAPTNERLYNSAFPGFNNYVRYIRVYAAICWMSKQVRSALERGEAATNLEAKRLFEAGLEKLELTLLWANLGAPALAGSRRRNRFPLAGEAIELKFDAFGPSEATLFAAVTYRPSLTNGLRLLEARSDNTYACLPFGDALADAFDESARELPGYRWLKSPDKASGTAGQIEALQPALDINNPSENEQLAFLATFFPEELDEETRNDDEARWLTLHLMLAAVDAVSRAKNAEGEQAAASTDEVRACMARGVATDGTAVVQPDVARVQAWWAVLQVRQLQRLCLEAIYCAVERWISSREIDGRGQSLESCVHELSEAGLAFLDETAEESVDALHTVYGGLQGDHGSLYMAAADSTQDDTNLADVFVHIARLKNGETLNFDDDGDCEALARAYEGLVFCAVETVNLSRNPDALQAMRSDNDACSMLRLVDFVNRHRSDSAAQFIGRLVKEWVVLRHFEVVASRAVAFDGKNRFRFVIGDYGLERFDKSASLPFPALAADKLEHALLLCKQAGLLSGHSEYRLTAAGRRRLG